MKYAVALFSGLFIFVAIFFLLSLLLSVILPASFFEVEIQIGSLGVNIPSMISLLIAAISARLTFKASLHAKTGKLYKK